MLINTSESFLSAIKKLSSTTKEKTTTTTKKAFSKAWFLLLPLARSVSSDKPIVCWHLWKSLSLTPMVQVMDGLWEHPNTPVLCLPFKGALRCWGILPPGCSLVKCSPAKMAQVMPNFFVGEEATFISVPAYCFQVCESLWPLWLVYLLSGKLCYTEWQ